MKKGMSAVLVLALCFGSVPFNAASVQSFAAEQSAASEQTEWEVLQGKLWNYTAKWEDASYRNAVSQRMVETALQGNGDVGVNSAGNSNEKTYQISKGDFWNCGNMNTDNIGSADANRVSPLSVGGLTIREKQDGEGEDRTVSVTGCGYIYDPNPTWNYDLDGIIDDKYSADQDEWACNGNTHAEDKRNHWFQVDLGGEVSLKRYVIYHQQTLNNSQPEMNTADFEVLVSTDGVHFESIQKVTGNVEKSTEFVLDEAKTVRYVKVVITKPNPSRDDTARIVEMSFFDENNKNLVTGDIRYDFSETLDITDGVLETNMIIGGTPVCMSSWVSATDNVMVTEVTSKGSEPVQLESALWVKADVSDFPPAAGTEGDAVWASKKTVNRVSENSSQFEKSWTSEVVMESKILGADARAVKNTDSEAGLSFTLKPGETVQVVTAVGGGGQNYDCRGNLQGIDPALEAAEILEKYRDKDDIARLKEENDAWWKDYWLKSYLDIGDEQLHRYYYGSLYYMACTSRADTLPTGLYGIWTTTDGAMWNGDYHMNYNYIAPFYGMYSSNRCEFAESLKDPLLDFMDAGEQRAKMDLANVYYNYIYGGNQPSENGTTVNNGKFDGRKDLQNGIEDGILYPVGLGPWGSYTWGGEHGGYLSQVYDAAFPAMGVTAYYNYTKDADYLQEVYPYLLANANFYEKWCEKEDLGYGFYRYNIWTGAHEGTFDLNSGTAIGAVKNILQCLIEGTEDGAIDPPAEKLALWKDMYENFAEYPVQEFVPQSDANFSYDKLYIPLSEVGAKFRAYEANVGLEFIAPGDQMGYDSDPDLREAARNSIELKELANANIWSQINETPKVYLHAVKCGVNPVYIIMKFKNLLSRSMKENYIIQDGYHGIEKAGAIEFINTMLLQSDNGIIKVFPNWTGDNASFTRLRTKGAFLVSSCMTDREIGDIEITSEKGGTVKLVNPWKDALVRVTDQDGNTVAWTQGETVHTGEQTIEFESRAEETYLIEGLEPADYTKVDEAWKKVPQDLEIYTETSVAALRNVLEAVDRNLSVKEQDQVDAMAKAIEEAIQNLLTREEAATIQVREDLKKEIQAGKAVIEKGQGSYTDSSWNRLCEAVKEAAALAEDDTVSGERLAAVQEKLRLALNSLEKKISETPVPEMPKKGSIHTAGKLKYKITSTSEKGGTVAVMAGTKKSMTSVKIPEEITIKGYRFRVTEIAAGAFKNYKKLTSVTIGSQVTKIGKSAFWGDTKLKAVIIQSKKLKSAGTRAFKNTGKKVTVRVPAGKRNAYRKMLRKSGLSENAAARIR